MLKRAFGGGPISVAVTRLADGVLDVGVFPIFAKPAKKCVAVVYGFPSVHWEPR